VACYTDIASQLPSTHVASLLSIFLPPRPRGRSPIHILPTLHEFMGLLMSPPSLRDRALPALVTWHLFLFRFSTWSSPSVTFSCERELKG
jgi:hypothetical protein